MDTSSCSEWCWDGHLFMAPEENGVDTAGAWGDGEAFDGGAHFAWVRGPEGRVDPAA